MGQSHLNARRDSPANFLTSWPNHTPGDFHYFSDWIDAKSITGPMNRAAVRACLERAPKVAVPILYGFYVSEELSLRAVDVVGMGNIENIRFRLSQFLRRGQSTGADAIILAYTAPLTPSDVSEKTCAAISKLRDDLDAYDLPLLDCLVIGPELMFGIGTW